MIYRLSLSQRLTLVFTAIMLICAVAVSAVQVRSSKQYGDAMVQRLSLELASKIVKSESLIDASGQVNRQTLKGLFNHLMTLNPAWSCIWFHRQVKYSPMPHRPGISSGRKLACSRSRISLIQMRCPSMATIRVAASKKYSAQRRFYITVSYMAICTLFCRVKT